MRPEAEKLLTDAREAGRAVLQFASGRSLGDYRRDLRLRSAVERQWFIVGEAPSQLRAISPSSFEGTPIRAASSAFAISWRTGTLRLMTPAPGTSSKTTFQRRSGRSKGCWRGNRMPDPISRLRSRRGTRGNLQELAFFA